MLALVLFTNNLFKNIHELGKDQDHSETPIKNQLVKNAIALISLAWS